jgi:uncharacterized MAPEG superfamily protein
MHSVYVILALALAQYMYFAFAVGGARVRYGVKAPSTTGHEMFERYYRVQMNTLEQLVVFVPALLVFAQYFDARIAAALGALYLGGRFLYFRSYVRDPAKRGPGFGLSFLPIVVLLIGGLTGALMALFKA